MSDFRFLDRRERRTIWQYIFWSVFVVVCVILLGWLIRWLLLPTRVIDPDEGLARWRWFYDQHEALNATAGNIGVAERSLQEFKDLNGDPAEWNFAQQDEYQRLTSVRDGYIVHYNNLANEYNAKMRDITRNWSAPPDLPYHINNWQEE